MKTLLRMRILLLMLLSWSGAVAAQAPLSDAAFSKSFRCPEALPSDQAREDAVKKFLVWAQQRHPDLTIRTVVELRTRLLEEHHCDTTLANIATSNTSENSSLRYRCTADDRRKYFTDQKASGCASVPIENGWVNFHSEPKVLVDILPSKKVKERDGTKIWTQFFLAESVSSDDGRWQYDQVKGITKYYCQTKQQLLIQGTYTLKGRIVYERSSAESIVEEIEPGTLAEGLYEYACKK